MTDCRHEQRVEGVCTVCGDCLHEVILNGACFLCGTTDLKIQEKPVLIEADRLTRKPDRK